MRDRARKSRVLTVAPSEPQKILIIGFSFLHRDARICRQIEFVKDHYRVWAAGFSNPDILGVTYLPIPEPLPTTWRQKAANLFMLKTRQFERYYWKRYGHLVKVLDNGDYDIIIANEIESLPIACMLAKRQKAKIIFDAHEYAPREFEDDRKWRFLYMAMRNSFCQSYLPRCHAITTVCPGIQAEYQKNFNVACQVITNADTFEHLKPTAVEENRIRLVYHGIAIPQRHIEVMIDVMKYLDSRFTLDLFLVPWDKGFLKKLGKKVAKNPGINLHPPLEMKSITRVLNNFDIGIDIIKPISFNNQHSLPNKFFTFIQSRLALAIGPSVEMKPIVETYDLGIIATDFSAKTMAAALLRLNKKKINRYKNQAHLAAYELSATHNKDKFLNILANVCIT